MACHLNTIAADSRSHAVARFCIDVGIAAFVNGSLTLRCGYQSTLRDDSPSFCHNVPEGGRVLIDLLDALR